MARRKAPVIADELLDQLLAGRDPRVALGKDGLIDELKRALAERALNAEMDHHLDGEAAEGRANSRNGYGRKTLLTDTGKLPIAVPRDRLSTFDPQLIAKYRRRLPGFDDKVISMYARGMTVREISGAPGRALWHRRLARPDQRRDRRHPRRDRRVAEPAARGGVPAGVLRRLASALSVF
jgi:putative transposase